MDMTQGLLLSHISEGSRRFLSQRRFQPSEGNSECGHSGLRGLPDFRGPRVPCGHGARRTAAKLGVWNPELFSGDSVLQCSGGLPLGKGAPVHIWENLCEGVPGEGMRGAHPRQHLCGTGLTGKPEPVSGHRWRTCVRCCAVCFRFIYFIESQERDRYKAAHAWVFQLPSLHQGAFPTTSLPGFPPPPTLLFEQQGPVYGAQCAKVTADPCRCASWQWRCHH